MKQIYILHLLLPWRIRSHPAVTVLMQVVHISCCIFPAKHHLLKEAKIYVVFGCALEHGCGLEGGCCKRNERSKEVNFSWLLFLDFPFLVLSGHLHLMISFALHQWLVIWSDHDAWFLPIGYTYLLGLGLQFCLFLTVPLSQTRTPSLIRCCYSPHGIQFLSLCNSLNIKSHLHSLVHGHSETLDLSSYSYPQGLWLILPIGPQHQALFNLMTWPSIIFLQLLKWEQKV